MPRNAEETLSLIAGDDVEVRRLALNLDQVEDLGLPPNPAKETDRRYPAYVEEFGTRESWELDALSPTVVDRMLREAFGSFIDQRKWKKAKASEKKNKALLSRVAGNWDAVVRDERL